MIRTISFSSSTSSPQRELDIDQMKHALQNPEGLLWVSLEQPDSAETDQILRDVFNFHPLAIEDSQSTGYQTAKIDEYGQYLLIIAHALAASTVHINSDSSLELNLFLGENYLVTSYNSADMPPVREVWERLQRDERIVQNGSDYLCHAILDHLVDDYFPLLDQMDETIEALEDQVLKNPTTDTLSKLLESKHDLMSLRRIISPQREVINRLSRDDYPMIDKQSRLYYRDVYDHLVRLQDLSESLRDIVSGALDIYLNSTSLRLNEVMRSLTIVSTIFLPLTFVAGIYGMNFDYMPEIPWRYGYLFVWVIFILIIVGMLAWFRHRKWF
jgi:magnesium transporter